MRCPHEVAGGRARSRRTAGRPARISPTALASSPSLLPPYLHRPRLRSVDAVTVRDAREGDLVVLRDGEGIAPRDVPLTGELWAIASRMDGARTLGELARAARAEGWDVTERTARDLAADLEGALLLDSPRFRAERRAHVEAFARRAARPAHHAGGAYPAEPGDLQRFIEDECLAKAGPPQRGGRVAALCAPHMDLWRASRGYGAAYAALAAGLSPALDTVVVLGTCHAGMRAPFAICDKPFETPLGPLPVDQDGIDWLARRARFDVHEDAYLHKAEHSIELQVIFLKHLLGPRPVRLIPILCGLGDAQARRLDPRLDGRAESLLEALEELVEARGERALVVAGADLAHVGPRFGDPAPLAEDGRRALAHRDEASVALALERDAAGFFDHTVEDLRRRRVCGVGPLYTLLRAADHAAEADLLSYEQCVDPDDGSIVSHASIAFRAR